MISNWGRMSRHWSLRSQPRRIFTLYCTSWTVASAWNRVAVRSGNASMPEPLR